MSDKKSAADVAVQNLMRVAPPSEEEESLYPESCWRIADELGITRSLSKAERDKIADEDFCGPHRSFPIDTQAHLDAAAKLIGHADNQSAVKACAKRKAKAKGFSLPDSWKEDDDDGKSRALGAGMHDLFTGKHVHAHQHGDSPMHTHHHTHANESDHENHSHVGAHDPLDGSHEHVHTHQDGTAHEHDHYHHRDGAHDHDHMGTYRMDAPTNNLVADLLNNPGTARSVQDSTVKFFAYAPIVRRDETTRAVTGQATAEVPDAYGTIFAFYPEAWQKWRGNMREQHNPFKAVGKAFEITPDESSKAIYVTSRVSRARDGDDTWTKIGEGILTGYSANVKPDPEFGLDPTRWPKKEYNGKLYPYLPRYEVIELSYVDAPATPGCEISLVRADGAMSSVVETNDVAPSNPSPPTELPLTDVQKKFHRSIARSLEGLLEQLTDCGCADCQVRSRLLSGEAHAAGGLDVGMVKELINQALHPVYMRFQAIASSLTRSSGGPQGDFQGQFDAINKQLTEMASILKRIDETPIPGPISNMQGTPAKQLATNPPQPARPGYGAVVDAITQLSNSGQLNTLDYQIDAVAAGLAAQRRGY